jgi:hypothetical protein
VTQRSNSQVDRLPFRCSRQGLQSFTACRTVFIVGVAWGLLLGPTHHSVGPRPPTSENTTTWKRRPIHGYGSPPPVAFHD